MVTLIVEDGTGKADANTFVSEVSSDTYWSDHGDPATWSGATSAVKTAALVAASEYANNKSYRAKKASGTQALAFPRVGIYLDGFVIESNFIPKRLTDAVCILALRHIEDGGLYIDVDNTGGGLQSITQKLGDLAETKVYAGVSNDQKQYAEVNALLRPLLVSGTEVVRG